MAVFVDQLMNHGWKLFGRFTPSCHLTCDNWTDLEELHQFAEALGLKRQWLHAGSVPHYDLTPSRRLKALELGAEDLERTEFVRRLRLARASATKMRGSFNFPDYIDSATESVSQPSQPAARTAAYGVKCTWPQEKISPTRDAC